MVSLSSVYAQYPMIKKIGNDTVVIITLKQGEEINKIYDQNKSQIKKLSDTVSILSSNVKTFKDSTQNLSIVNTKTRVESDSFKHMYIENKKIYMEKERQFKRDRKMFAFNTGILAILVMILSYL